MPTDINLYARLPYSVVVIPEKGEEAQLVYVASHPELPGCMSHGATPDEALANLAEARTLYIRTLLEKHIEVPVPVAFETVTSGDYQRIVWEVIQFEVSEPDSQLQFPIPDHRQVSLPAL